ncbi:MAG: DNA repair protein [Bacteroidetes bacterium 43-16]|nr:MAG: DNA repair protein [Bacteroidetes bacterium 43-16]
MEKSNEFDVNHVSEVELIYRSPVKPSQRPVVKSSKAAYDLFMTSWDQGKIELQEHFKVLLLNRACRVLGIFTLSEGGMESTVIDKKLLFATILKSNASKIILAHNHPAGGLVPSVADVTLTKALVLGAKTLDIKIEDHLIVTREGYYSFTDNGISLNFI